MGVVQQPLACRLSIPAVLTEARVGAICHPDQSWNSACLLREQIGLKNPDIKLEGGALIFSYQVYENLY